MEYIIDPSHDHLISECVGKVIGAIVEVWLLGEPAHIVITGGRTGLAIAEAVDSQLFALIRANSSYEGSMLHIWFSDERFTSYADSGRNDTTLIAGFGLCQSHLVFHRVAESGELDEVAARYAQEIDLELEGRPFEAVILSMGEDGHVASLFPERFDPLERRAAISVHDSPKPPTERVSISLSRLSNSHNIFVFALGQSKADALAHILDGPVGSLESQKLANTLPGALLPKSSLDRQLQIYTDLQIPIQE
jgi:6-phosphogluconolactonase